VGDLHLAPVEIEPAQVIKSIRRRGDTLYVGADGNLRFRHAGSAGQVLTSSGPNADPFWSNAGGTGGTGNTIIYGSGAPDDNVGSVGDLYIDTTSAERWLYAGKLVSGWNLSNRTELRGPSGPGGTGGSGGGTIITYDTDPAQPSDSEGVVGEERQIVTQTTPPVVIGYYLKGADGTWSDFVQFPASRGAAVTNGTGGPDRAAFSSAGDMHFQVSVDGGGYLWIATPTGWPTLPQCRLPHRMARMTYNDASRPGSLEYADEIHKVLFDGAGVAREIQIQWENGGVIPPPDDSGGGTPPPPVTAMPQPSSFLSTPQSGYVALAWPAPATSGDEALIGWWRVDSKLSGQADSAYTPVANLQVDGVTVAGAYVQRVDNATSYEARDVTSRSLADQVVYRLTAFDSSRQRPSTPVTTTSVTIPSAQPTSVAVRALTAGTTDTTTLTGQLSLNGTGVVGTDARAPAVGDLVHVLAHSSPVTSSGALPAQMFLAPTGAVTGGGVDVTNTTTRNGLYTSSESQLTRTDGLLRPAELPELHDRDSTGWTTGGANQWFVGFYHGAPVADVRPDQLDGRGGTRPSRGRTDSRPRTRSARMTSGSCSSSTFAEGFRASPATPRCGPRR
jgi:hypothetical protein